MLNLKDIFWILCSLWILWLLLLLVLILLQPYHLLRCGFQDQTAFSKWEEIEADNMGHRYSMDSIFLILSFNGIGLWVFYVAYLLMCTAGQERFGTVISSYYRGAHGIILGMSLKLYKHFILHSDWSFILDLSILITFFCSSYHMKMCLFTYFVSVH